MNLLVAPPSDTWEPRGSAQPHTHPSQASVATENEVSSSVGINVRHINNGGHVPKDRDIGNPDSTTDHGPRNAVRDNRGITEPTTLSEADTVSKDDTPPVSSSYSDLTINIGGQEITMQG